jgi:plasmid stabilization system protein ParE
VRIRYTKRAELCVQRLDAWWRAHRFDAPDLFFAEVENTLQLLLNKPDLGVVYKTRRGTAVRRMLLPRTQYHLYYEHDQQDDQLMIITIWGGKRRRGPKL